MANANGQYKVLLPIIRRLTDTGKDVSGVQTNFNEDYSSTSKTAFILPDVGEQIAIHSINFAITDSGTFADDDYGNIVGGLTNGAQVEIIVSGFTVGSEALIVNTNAELFSLDSSAQIIEYSSNDRTLVATFKLVQPIFLNGNTEDQFGVVLSDDLSGLRIHEFTINGTV